MNELLRVSGFIGVGLIVLNTAKACLLYLDRKKLSRMTAAELYEQRNREERGFWEES